MKNASTKRLASGYVRTVFVIWLLVFAAAAWLAWNHWPMASPRPPDLTGPTDRTVIAGGDDGAAFELRWSHGGLAPRGAQQAKPATRFVVCIYRAQHGQTCTGQVDKAPLVLESYDPDDLTRSRVPLPGIRGWIVEQVDPAYQYRRGYRLPGPVEPGPMSWTVAACAGISDGSCVWAPANRLVVDDVNLVLHDIVVRRGAAGIEVSLDVENEGSHATGPFLIFTQVWPVRADGNGGMLADPAAPGVDPQRDRAITRYGRVVPLTEVDEEIIAIVPADAVPGGWRKTFEGVPADTRQRVEPCSVTPCTLQSTAPGAQLLAAVVRVDSNANVPETNEIDNIRVSEAIRVAP